MTDAVRLRSSRPEDLAWITALERREEHLEQIGQWSDAEHLAAMAGEGGREHWIIERDGGRAGYLIAFDTRAEDGGVYVKRILVDVKERGTGKRALQAFVDSVRLRPGARYVWLIVRERNLRAQAVYLGLGFTRFEPPEDAAKRLDTSAEPPVSKSFRMRLDL